MKILIAGGFGYLGGRMAMHLSSLGHEVFLGSRNSKSKPDWLLKGDVVKLNWEDHESLLFACRNMDIVLQMSGLNAYECFSDPKAALKVNGEFTGRLASASKEKKVEKFIYLSTAHVYNGNLKGRINENTNPSNDHPYATSHIAGEKEVILNSNEQMKGVIVRLANSFGYPSRIDNDCWSLVANDLSRQASENNELVIRGSPNNLRNFITLTDVCNGIEFLMHHKMEPGSVLTCNLGDKTMSIYDLASQIKEIYKEVTGIELPINSEIEKLASDSNALIFESKLMKSIGFRWNSNFYEELKDLIKFCELSFKN